MSKTREGGVFFASLPRRAKEPAKEGSCSCDGRTEWDRWQRPRRAYYWQDTVSEAELHP